MQTAKQDVAALVAALPDDVSIEEIQYRLHVLEQIRAGRAELDAGLGMTHDEAMRRLARWRDG